MKTKTIEHTVLLPGSPKRVYDTYMDAKRHAAFTGARAKIAKRPGGRMTAWDGYIDGEMLVLRPGKRIVQTWQTQNWPAGAAESILDIRLRATGKRTELTMVHSGILASPASLAKGFRTGWHSHYWVLMRKYLR